MPPLVPGNEVDPFKSHELEPERRASQRTIRMLLLEEGGLEDKRKETITSITLNVYNHNHNT